MSSIESEENRSEDKRMHSIAIGLFIGLVIAGVLLITCLDEVKNEVSEYEQESSSETNPLKTNPLKTNDEFITNENINEEEDTVKILEVSNDQMTNDASPSNSVIDLIIISKEQFEIAKNIEVDDDKIVAFKEVNRLCDEILSQGYNDVQIFNRKMHCNIEIGKLVKDQYDRSNYFSIARNSAFSIIKNSISAHMKTNAQYYYAFCSYEMAKGSDDKTKVSEYEEALSIFENLVEYEPYSIQYVLLINRQLYYLSGEIDYLINASNFYIENSSRKAGKVEEFEILREASDIDFLIGEYYYAEKNISASSSYFELSESSILKAQKIRHIEYFDSQLKRINRYVMEESNE